MAKKSSLPEYFRPNVVVGNCYGDELHIVEISPKRVTYIANYAVGGSEVFSIFSHAFQSGNYPFLRHATSEEVATAQQRLRERGLNTTTYMAS